jgi:hypothetical protein
MDQSGDFQPRTPLLPLPQRNLYLARPVEDHVITAASYVTDGGIKKIKLGTGLCHIFHRKTNTAARTFAENNNGSAAYLNMEITEKNYEEDEYQEFRVYNPHFYEFRPMTNTDDDKNVDPRDPLLFVLQDAHGDYMIISEVDSGIYPARLNGILNANSFIGATLFYRATDNSGALSVSSRTITVHDFLLNSGETMANQTRVWVRRHSGFWYVVSGGCAASNITPPPPGSDSSTFGSFVEDDMSLLSRNLGNSVQEFSVIDSVIGSIGTGTGIPPPGSEGEES